MSLTILSLALLIAGLATGKHAGEKFAASVPNLPKYAYPIITAASIISAVLIGAMNGFYGMFLAAIGLGWSFRGQQSWLVVIGAALVVAYELLLAAATEAAGLPFNKEGETALNEAASDLKNGNGATTQNQL
jgi:succinate dehydrogenase/fumarate reductase cytochrome b subunit